jgi:pimeloyl-ACP methyl ester carboxylesterase/sugar-specific transcriptional regulator TrmB
VVELSETTIIEVLQSLGLTEKEAEVYIFLAKHGPMKGVKIAKQLRKHKAQIYRILRRLQKNNIVESTLEAPTRFSARPFEKVLDQFIRSKQEEATFIERTKKEWLNDWERIRKARIQPITEKFVVIEGKKKIYLKILQMIAQTKNQISLILPISKISRAEQFGVFDEIKKHPIKSKIKFRVLTELSKQNLKATKLLVPKIKNEIDFRAIIPNSEQRTLPRMVIRDKNEVLFFISPKTDLFTGQNESALFINSTSLVETLIGTFEDLWKDSIFIEDRIFEIETGKILPKPCAEKGTEILSDYQTTLTKVKNQLISLPSLSAQLSRIESSLPIFVGRQDELRQLEEFLEKTRKGNGNTIIIGGEAGIGKTRLVDELMFTARSKNIRVIKCNCSQDSKVPQLAIRKILKEIFELSENENPDLRSKEIREKMKDFDPQLMTVIPAINNLFSNLSFRPKVHSDQFGTSEDLALLLKSELIFENLAKIIISFSFKQPLILFVDDLHLADSSFLKFFKNIAKKIQKSNLLLIGACRQTSIIKTSEGIIHPLFDTVELLNNESLFQNIELKSLTQPDCSKLINNILGIYNYNFEKLIYQETKGNPFYILETIKFLINKKIITPKDEKWALTKSLNEIELPHTLRDVISLRISLLSEEERDILDCASVIGEQFTSNLIKDITDLNRLQVLKRLNKIERKYQLIHSNNDKYRFDHSKIRQFLYHEITSELRKEYHSLIAKKLEENNKNHLNQVVNQLAYHYYYSENSEKAIPYLLQAGQNLRKEYMFFETIRCFVKALEMMSNNEKWNQEKTKTLELLGGIYGFVAEHEMANECYLKGIASTKDESIKDRLQKKIRRKKNVDNKGVRLTYYVYGQGEPTILFYCWRSSTEFWIPQVTYFSQKCKVVTLDMRGTGNSDKPIGEYTADVLTDDLDSIIDDLQAKNLVIVGSNYGTKIVVKYVAQYPEKISKLVLLSFYPGPISSSPNFNEEMFEKWRQMALKSPSWFVDGFWKGAFPDPKLESLREWGLKSAKRTPPEIFRDGWYNIVKADVRSLLKKIDVPTLIIGGDKDNFDIENTKYLQEEIPNAERQIIRGIHSKLIPIFAARKLNQIMENYLNI